MNERYKTLALMTGLLNEVQSTSDRELMETRLRIFADTLLLNVLQVSLKHADELLENGQNEQGRGILTNNGVLVKHFNLV